MPKYYCDYCDTYLTHDSPSVRKTHCNGRKHKDNVKIYYVMWMERKAQSIIDATTAAFKSAKLQPFSNAVKPPPGVMIPPPPSLQGGHPVAPGPVMGPPPMNPMGAPMRGPMPVMGPPGPGMMMPGMRPVAMMQIGPIAGPMRAPML